jgi:hypothetical protein
VILFGELKAQGEPLRITYNGVKGVFWTIPSEDTLINKMIDRDFKTAVLWDLRLQIQEHEKNSMDLKETLKFKDKQLISLQNENEVLARKVFELGNSKSELVYSLSECESKKSNWWKYILAGFVAGGATAVIYK